MNCPICQQAKVKVVDSRDIQDYDATKSYPVIDRASRLGIDRGIVRERRCGNCNSRLFTHETVIHVEKWRPRR